MTGLDRLHQNVAEIALRAAGRGFALGGGNALIAHGIISRATQDVDLFTDEEAGVSEAADAVEAALHEAGYRAERTDNVGEMAEIFEGIGDGLAEWVITAPGGRRLVLQMAYFDRSSQPVTMDIGPVLGIEDVVGGKACALASRAEPRDYIDIAAALNTYTVTEIISFAQRLDPGLEDRDFSDAGDRLDQWGDHIFAAYGLTPSQISTLRQHLANWPRN